jgi:hypothetical protein
MNRKYIESRLSTQLQRTTMSMLNTLRCHLLHIICVISSNSFPCNVYLHHMQTVDAFWKGSSGDMSWHAGRDQAQHSRVVNDHPAKSNLVARMWQVKVTWGPLCISACRWHVVLAQMVRSAPTSLKPHFSHIQQSNGKSNVIALLSHQSFSSQSLQSWNHQQYYDSIQFFCDKSKLLTIDLDIFQLLYHSGVAHLSLWDGRNVSININIVFLIQKYRLKN